MREKKYHDTAIQYVLTHIRVPKKNPDSHGRLIENMLRNIPTFSDCFNVAHQVLCQANAKYLNIYQINRHTHIHNIIEMITIFHPHAPKEKKSSLSPVIMQSQ